MEGPDQLYPEVCEVGGFRSGQDVCTLRPGRKPEELEKMLFNKSLLWPGPFGRMWLQESNPLSTDFSVCTKQGNRIWMSSLHLLKYLMKTQRCLIPIFTLPSKEGEWQMFAHKVDLKNSNWESGMWEGRASSLSKECELWNFEPLVPPLGFLSPFRC